MEKDVELEGIPKEDLLNMKNYIENKIELPNLKNINLEDYNLDLPDINQKNIPKPEFIPKDVNLEKLDIPKFDINNKFLDENTSLDNVILTEEENKHTK